MGCVLSQGNIDQAYNDIYHGSPSSSLTDANKSGYGAIFDSTKTNGLWSISESFEHVNVQEIKAILFGLMDLVNQTGLHIKILSDNTTAVSGVNKMGTSHSKECKVCSINFEPPDNDLCSCVPRLPTFSWSMNYVNTIYIEWIYLGWNYII